MARITGQIHHADIKNSPRLQRMLQYLLDGQERSTLEIILHTPARAVSAAAKELRVNIGNDDAIRCRKGNFNTYYYHIPAEHIAAARATLASCQK